jgi:hypothetical protein
MKGDLLVVQSKRINPINLGISKDTWIISDSLQELQSHKNSSNIVLKLKEPIKSISTALTSRNAENLFWVGRLSERTMLTSLKNNF